jgi:hypothetical protein
MSFLLPIVLVGMRALPLPWPHFTHCHRHSHVIPLPGTVYVYEQGLVPCSVTEEGIQLKLVGVAAEPLYRYLMQPPTHHCPVPPSHVIISASSLPKTSMRAACGIQYLHVTNRRPPLRVRKVANKKKVKRGRGRGPRIVQGPPPPPAGLTTKP